MSGPPLTVGVVGAGRLGGAVLRACREAGVAVTLRATARGGWTVESVPDVLIDASAPAALPEVASFCVRHRVPLLECVSHPGGRAGLLRETAEVVPVVEAVNLSFGSYVQRLLTASVAGLAHPCAPDVDVLDRHPVRKAPRVSATAERLARTWADAGGRPPARLGLRRGGLEVSDHDITWVWNGGEALTIRHQVTSLAAAAAAAVGIARLLPGRPPGLLSVDDMFPALLRTTE